MTDPEFSGTCRNGHRIQRELPLTDGEIAGRPSMPIRCRCGAITECYRSDKEGGSRPDRTRPALAPDPLVAADPDCRFGGGVDE